MAPGSQRYRASPVALWQNAVKLRWDLDLFWASRKAPKLRTHIHFLKKERERKEKRVGLVLGSKSGYPAANKQQAHSNGHARLL